MSNRTEYSELTKTELLHDFYAMQARLDEAVELLRRMKDQSYIPGKSPISGALNIHELVRDANAFLSTLENGGA